MMRIRACGSVTVVAISSASLSRPTLARSRASGAIVRWGGCQRMGATVRQPTSTSSLRRAPKSVRSSSIQRRRTSRSPRLSI
uniref:Putative secreted protein n=1 Tax=Anopheles darlingi TaxID=43151 RepID=A0A2M4DAR5_ANODA